MLVKGHQRYIHKNKNEYILKNRIPSYLLLFLLHLIKIKLEFIKLYKLNC